MTQNEGKRPLSSVGLYEFEIYKRVVYPALISHKLASIKRHKADSLAPNRGDTYHPTPPTQGATYRYEYDESGNMTSDEYKDVNIHYNVLNLPDTITIVNRGQIANTYLADGTLIRRQYYACTTEETPSANIPLLRGGRGVFQLTRTAIRHWI